MQHEVRVLEMKYQAALRSLTTASDTIFALDAELTITKERLAQAERQLAMAAETKESVD